MSELHDVQINETDDLDTLKAKLESRRSYDQAWGRNHNVGFHMILIIGVAVAVFAIVSDFLGIAKGTSIVGLIGGGILAAPAAFKMKEKSLWYFEYASQLEWRRRAAAPPRRGARRELGRLALAPSRAIFASPRRSVLAK